MTKVEKTSQLSLEFSLSWTGATAWHEERLFAEKVSVWRDVFPGDMHNQLLGKAVGDTVATEIEARQFFAPHSQQLLRTIKPRQFAPPAGQHFNVGVPLPGRFYPQYYLQEVPGVYSVSVAPCRFLTVRPDGLLFDLNHPLAGKQLTLAATIRSIDHVRVERGGRCEAWLESICDGGPGMQDQSPYGATAFLAGEPFKRQDEHPDTLFYQTPRLVQHLDDTALRLIAEEFGRVLPPRGAVLDLMGSWDSHLPDSLFTKSLAVLGMNGLELAKNRRADSTIVHDVNEQPRLPFSDGVFDAVINTAAIEYGVDPLALCREASRILRPGGVVAIAFSNRWFAGKAISLWSQLHEFERVAFVVSLLSATNSFTDIATLSIRGYPRPEGDPHSLPFSDPVYMVTAKKIRGSDR